MTENAKKVNVMGKRKTSTKKRTSTVSIPITAEDMEAAMIEMEMPTEAAFIARVSALLADGYTISQEDARTGECAIALMFHLVDSTSVYLSWYA
jgi:hypothetical protein